MCVTLATANIVRYGVGSFPPGSNVVSLVTHSMCESVDGCTHRTAGET